MEDIRYQKAGRIQCNQGESPLESSPGAGGIAGILAASWASEIVTNGRDQCTRMWDMSTENKNG